MRKYRIKVIEKREWKGKGSVFTNDKVKKQNHTHKHGDNVIWNSNAIN